MDTNEITHNTTITGFTYQDILDHAFRARVEGVTKEMAENIISTFGDNIDDVAISMGNDYIAENVAEWVKDALL